MTDDRCYAVVGNRPWNRRVFEEKLAGLPGRWVFLAACEEVSAEHLDELAPDTVFFLHWSAIVPAELVERHRCVGFHMADLPYGRGGTPLQNLIVRGHTETVLTAFLMDAGMDTGPVLLKEPLSLEGTAEAVYVRQSYLAASMVERIVRERPEPVPQTGTPSAFERRTPADSRLGGQGSLREVVDFVRMLDAEGYPHAFVEVDGLRLELRRAALYDGRVQADVTITLVEEES